MKEDEYDKYKPYMVGNPPRYLSAYSKLYGTVCGKYPALSSIM